jgi:hypothetical protein
MSDKTGPALSGQYLPQDDAEKVANALDRVRQQGITAQVAARISKSVFFSKIQERRVRAATAVIQAEEDLMRALIDHRRTRERLIDLDIEIEADRLDRRNRLAAAQRQAELNDLDGRIARKERELRLAQLERASEGFDSNAQERKYREQLESAERKAAFEVEMKVLQARKNLQMVNELLKERDRMIREVSGGKEGRLSSEQELQVDNIRDFFQRLIDEI